MNVKNLVVLALVVLALTTIAGFALNTAPAPSSSLQLVSMVVSAAQPTVTDTPAQTTTAAATATATDTPSPTSTSTPTASPTRTATITRTRTPTATPNPALRVIRVPILMYHYVGVAPPDADKYRLDLTVTPDAFNAQMENLAANGYTTIRLSDLNAFLLGGAPLPPKPVVLTFDDGYTDNYTNAFPILKNWKFNGTFFVITKAIEENRWGYMSWAQLAEMAAAGMEIGSHTVDHPDLYRKSLTYQQNQLAASKQMIESRLGVTVVSFAYPSGKYDKNTIASLHATGYLGAVTEIQGTRQTSDDIYELRRIRVRGSYGVPEFAYWIKYFLDNGK